MYHDRKRGRNSLKMTPVGVDWEQIGGGLGATWIWSYRGVHFKSAEPTE
jgi:hypothetical protein